MDLREYLFRKRKSITTFGQEIGFSRIHLSKIINGERNPGKKLAKIICEATNGEVKIYELSNKSECTCKCRLKG